MCFKTFWATLEFRKPFDAYLVEYTSGSVKIPFVNSADNTDIQQRCHCKFCVLRYGNTLSVSVSISVVHKVFVTDIPCQSLIINCCESYFKSRMINDFNSVWMKIGGKKYICVHVSRWNTSKDRLTRIMLQLREWQPAVSQSLCTPAHWSNISLTQQASRLIVFMILYIWPVCLMALFNSEKWSY